jgi:hypothetical protein
MPPFRLVHLDGVFFDEIVSVLTSDVGREPLIHAGRRIGVEFADLVGNQGFAAQASDFALAMSRQHRILELLAAIRVRNPLNPNLIALESKLKQWWNREFAAFTDLEVGADIMTLESFVRPHLGDMSMDAWIDGAVRVRRAVCRVESESANGTGFLISKDLVLTARHVLQAANSATCWFDDDETRQPQAVAASLVHAPASDLDYCALRLAQPFQSRDPLGWNAMKPTNGDPLIVVQHPGGNKKRIAQGSVKGATPPFLEHDANTAEGTSGAPCLNAHWKVVGVHRAGLSGSKNQAVAISSVLQDLPQGMLPT